MINRLSLASLLVGVACTTGLAAAEGGGEGPAVTGHEVRARILKRFDGDGDGELDQSELKRIHRHWRRLAQDERTWVRRTYVVVHKDGETVIRRRTDRVHAERVDDHTTTWTRDTRARDSEGRSREKHVEGRREVDDEGGGRVTRTYTGQRRNAEGEERSFSGDTDRQWEENELGGRDTVETHHRENSEGRSADAETQRRSKATEDGHAYKEATRVVDDGGRERWARKEGRNRRIHTDDGYIDYRIERGEDLKGRLWTREHRKTVVYGTDERRIEVVVAFQRDGHVYYDIATGTYTRLPNGRGWRYEGQATKKKDNKVQSTREVNRTCRTVPCLRRRPTAEECEAASDPEAGD